MNSHIVDHYRLCRCTDGLHEIRTCDHEGDCPGRHPVARRLPRRRTSIKDLERDLKELTEMVKRLRVDG